MARSTAWAVVLLLPICMGAASTRPATRPAGPSRAIPNSPGKFFGLDRVWTIHIRVSQSGWKTMQPSRMPRFLMLNRPTTGPTTRRVYEEGDRLEPNPFGLMFAYVRGEVEFEGRRITDVGIRFKGNSSFLSAGEGRRRPFKLDFSRFVDGQTVAGLRAINLHNNAFDPSQMREALSYAVYRDAGVPAPRTAWALVYLTIDGQCNGEYLGMYTIVEPVDEQFLKNNFDSRKGLLVKPEGALGGLPFLGDKWAAYEARYRPRSRPTTRTAGALIELARLVNQADDKTFAEQIESLVDVDEFLRYLAATTVLSNLDSILTTAHNFYLYIDPRTNRASFIPWDLNLSLGAFTTFLSAQQQTQLSIAHPHMDKHLFIDRILAIEKFRATYRKHLAKLLERGFEPDKLCATIDRIARVLKKGDEAARLAGKLGSATTRPALTFWLAPAPPLKDFVRARADSVRMQLAGQSEGFSPGAIRRRGFAGPATRPTTRPAGRLSLRPTTRPGNPPGP